MKSLLEVKITNYNNKDKKNQQHNNNNLELEDNDLIMDDDQISIHSKNNYFQILCDFCLFNNEDPALELTTNNKNNDRIKVPLYAKSIAGALHNTLNMRREKKINNY